MKPRKGKRLLARAGLVVWGLFTLALLLAVTWLTQQLIQLGSNPLSFVFPKPEPVVESAPAVQEAPQTRVVTLYYGDPRKSMLRAERRSLPVASSTVENCKAALQEIIKGPTAGLAPIIPPSTKAPSVYLLEDGELVVDLAAEAIDPTNASAASEALLVFGITNTLTQGDLAGKEGPPVRKVRLLIDGRPYMRHIDVSAAYGPNSTWIATSPEDSKGNG